MLRLKLLLMAAGGALIYFGYQEFQVGRDASATPVEVTLSSLEQGEPAPNVHLQVDEHIALYHECVYSYRQNKGEVGEPGPEAKVNFAYYPIISAEHPFVQSEDNSATLDTFAVLVKTHRLKTVGDIPDIPRMDSEVSGLVINRIGSLKKDEKQLIAQSFPSMNLDQVLILQEGRKPSGMLIYLGEMIGGLVMIALAGVWLFTGRSQA